MPEGDPTIRSIQQQLDCREAVHESFPPFRPELFSVNPSAILVRPGARLVIIDAMLGNSAEVQHQERVDSELGIERPIHPFHPSVTNFELPEGLEGVPFN